MPTASEAAAQLGADAIAVVLPFENPDADPQALWLREGLAMLVSDAIESTAVEVVSREERIASFERLQLPVAATLSRASTVKVGLAVGATALVVGRVDLEGDVLRVSARLVQLETGRLTPEVEETGRLPDLFALAARLGARLAGAPEATQSWTPPPSLPAFELYVKGLTAEAPAAERALLEQALKSAPSFDAVRLALWHLHTEQGQHQRALETVAMMPSGGALEPDARFASAMSLLRLKRDEEAFDVLRTLQSSAPRAAVANAIGVVQLRRGGGNAQTGRATYFFNQATELDPAEADYFFNLGYAYWMEKDARAAAYWLGEAVRRDPTDGDAHFVLAAALRQTGAAAEAARERELAVRLSSRYEQWESRGAGSDPIPRGLERLHERLDAPAGRVDTILATSGQRDQAALAAFHLDAARRAFAREADREAERELRRAIYLSPYLAEAHLLLGRLQLRAGHDDAAVQALKIAVWSEPSAAAHTALAEAYVAAGDMAAARAEVERALALDPRDAAAMRLKAQLTGRSMLK